MGFKASNFGVSDSVTENGIERGLGRNKGLFCGHIEFWRIQFVTGRKRQQSTRSGGARLEEGSNMRWKLSPEKRLEQAKLISKREIRHGFSHAQRTAIQLRPHPETEEASVATSAAYVRTADSPHADASHEARPTASTAC